MWPKLKSATWEIVKFLALTLAIVLPVRAYVAQPFIVSGNSMDPTFKNNEYLIVDELSYRLREPERGEVVVFKFPKQPSAHFIKRIIGLPGETVIIKGSKVTIDTGRERFALAEDYIAAPFQANLELKLLPGEYFVMGDNRSVSLDSRSWGPLPREMMTGRVLARLLPPSRINFLPGAATAVN